MAQDPSELVFTLDKLYLLKKDGSAITLDVIIGPKGQSPLLDVKLDSKLLLPANHDKSVKNLDIGIDNTLSKKILSIVGNVVDTADDSDKIQVTIKLKGGVTEINKKFIVTVEESGEEVDIDFNIRFK
jgi:hypothetical protein